MKKLTESQKARNDSFILLIILLIISYFIFNIS